MAQQKKNNKKLSREEKYMQKKVELSKEELKALLNEGNISKEDYKALIKCNKVKIKPINPLIVLCGAKKTTINDAGRDESSYALAKTLQRPIIMVVISFVVNSISTTFIGGSNIVLDVMLGIFTIVVASFCGFTTGVNDFKYTEDRTKSRALFLALFCEKNNI